MGIVSLVLMFFLGAVLFFVALGCFVALAIKTLIHVYRNDGSEGPDGLIIIISIIMIAILVMVMVTSIVNVPAGHKMVITSAPDSDRIGDVMSEGWTIDPYLMLCEKELIRYNQQAIEFVGADYSDDCLGSITVRSADNLEVYMDFSITYEIPEDRVAYMRINYGDYRHTVIEQVARSVPRDVASHFNGEDFADSTRGHIESAIREQITDKLEAKGLRVIDFSMREIRIPDSLSDAIEAKKVAEQNMVTANYTAQAAIITAQGQARAAIIAAEGEAKSVLINADAAAVAQIVKANSTAEAIKLVSNMLQAQYGESNVTAYLDYLYIQALTDPNSNIEFVVVPSEGGTPILITPRA